MVVGASGVGYTAADTYEMQDRASTDLLNEFYSDVTLTRV